MVETLEPTSYDKKSDAWNVAQGYTQLKILKPLVELDKLVRIAKYGTDDIENSLMTPIEIKTQSRIEAIFRIVDVLKEIIENAEFAMTTKSKETLGDLYNKLGEIDKVIDLVYRESYDQRVGSTQIKINESHFALCLKHLRNIKRDITKPLNESSLIFPTSDEIDLDKIKNELIMGG